MSAVCLTQSSLVKREAFPLGITRLNVDNDQFILTVATLPIITMK